MWVWELLIVVLLVMLNGFFAMSELAVVSSRRVRLQQLAEAGSKGARAALNLVADPSRFLSTVQIGITLVAIFSGAYGGATLSHYLAEWLRTMPAVAGYADQFAFAAVVILLTYLSLIIGELVPKRLALNNAERIASFVARPMALFSKVGAPLVWFLGVSADGILRLFGAHIWRKTTVTEEEVKSLIAEGTEAGVFERAEKQMIEGVLRLADRSARSIMTPRLDVVWLDPGDDPADIMREITESGRSRFPLCRGNLDELIGVVQTKDLLYRLMRGESFDLTACVRDPLVVHERTPLLKLLELFKQSPLKLAVVVDEYGSVEGIVTLTDILSAIAGDIETGADEDTPKAVLREDGSWLIDGLLPIDEAEQVLNVRGMQGDGDYHTLAGFVLSRIGHIPVAAEHFSWHGHRFEVVDMDGRRIDKVLVSPPGEPAGSPVE